MLVKCCHVGLEPETNHTAGIEPAMWLAIADARPPTANPRRGASAPCRAPRRAADPGWDRPHGRAQLRPLAAAGAPRPERGGGAPRVVGRRRLAQARRRIDLHR